MNPCLHGGCSIANFPQAPSLKYLKCSCVLQYTGEYCTELVEGAVAREIFRFSPFIAHICSTLCIFVIFFCCKKTASQKKIISLENVAPRPPDLPDNLKSLYPAAMLPAFKNEDYIGEMELNVHTIAQCLEKLRNEKL
ncbi:unnamed protein product [Thelazia callipaeda]|uniref:EGF-like domain-containing protein n=1 Tax=Thelazia callipaeda TaxID=103827 RepID=A0A0N5CP74_THECL|nr:unnamed protein product [Thelazia callipaeda]